MWIFDCGRKKWILKCKYVVLGLVVLQRQAKRRYNVRCSIGMGERQV